MSQARVQPPGADEVPAASGIRFPEGTVAEEIAVVVALLAASGGQVEAGPQTPAEWGAPARATRRPVTARPGGWRASSLP